MKKLILRKESIRTLVAPALSNVHGGVVRYSVLGLGCSTVNSECNKCPWPPVTDEYSDLCQ